MKKSISDRIADKPLTGKQKGVLAMLYKKAFARAQAHHADEGLSEEAWRHAQCREAAGVTIKEATQRHYNALKGHAEDMLGDSGAALRTALRDPEEERRRPLLRLIDQCILAHHAYGMTVAYAATITSDKFDGRRLDALNVVELEHLLMTLRARGAAMKKKVNEHVAECGAHAGIDLTTGNPTTH
jgi:hypothetical protein